MCYCIYSFLLMLVNRNANVLLYFIVINIIMYYYILYVSVLCITLFFYSLKRVTIMSCGFGYVWHILIFG